MTRNVGGIDKVLRISAGVALLSMMVWMEGSLRWLGLIGLVPLATGLTGWCPVYIPFGINTCPADDKKSS